MELTDERALELQKECGSVAAFAERVGLGPDAARYLLWRARRRLGLGVGNPFRHNLTSEEYRELLEGGRQRIMRQVRSRESILLGTPASGESALDRKLAAQREEAEKPLHELFALKDRKPRFEELS